MNLSDIVKEHRKIWLVSGWQRWLYTSILVYINLKLLITQKEYALNVLFFCVIIIFTCILVEDIRYSKWLRMFERYISFLAVTKVEVEDYIVLSNKQIKYTYILDGIRHEGFEYAEVIKKTGIEKPYFNYVYLDDTNSTEGIRDSLSTRKFHNTLYVPSF